MEFRRSLPENPTCQRGGAALALRRGGIPIDALGYLHEIVADQ